MKPNPAHWAYGVDFHKPTLYGVPLEPEPVRPLTYHPSRGSWPWTDAQWREVDARKKFIDRAVHRFMVGAWVAAAVALLLAFGPKVLQLLVWWWQ